MSLFLTVVIVTTLLCSMVLDWGFINRNKHVD